MDPSNDREKTDLSQKSDMKQKSDTDHVGNIALLALCKVMHSQGFAQYLLCICGPISPCFPGQSILLNVADSCYLYFYVLPPLFQVHSAVLSCWADSGKIQRDTIITAYVPREEDL